MLLRRVNRGVYVFIPEAEERLLLRLLRSRLSTLCEGLSGSSWEGLLTGLAECAEQRGELLLVIDEFQRLGPGFISHLQLLADTLPDSPLKLVLLGSAVSVIDRIAGALGPLYGRCVLVKLAGFRFLEAFVMLRERLGASPLQAFETYSVFGGSPYNLSLVETLDWRREAKRHIHSVYGRLYEEPLHVLSSETREPGVYASILEAIARGRRSFSEIAQVVHRTSLVKYLEVLRNLGIVERVVPAGENPLRTKKAQYVIGDPFWDYWFKMVYPRRDEAELSGEVGLDEEGVRLHMSEWFERVARELVSRLYGVKASPWWSREVEIDVIAPTSRGAYVFEIKYREVDSSEAERLLRSLEAKTTRLPMKMAGVGLIALRAEHPGGDYIVMGFDELVEAALAKSSVRVERLA
ncbi:hypothetical protein PABY_14390 [Pyrodictium abyssi]|uniref:DUF234 domain-containing protein n=2 Tax=Pyrodictium abyssi TaxID=54256 RepID=A0ABM8IY92_9CREN|nr:hypothetical protein PABY_14390 [Pyrodictium abyssi]